MRSKPGSNRLEKQRARQKRPTSSDGSFYELVMLFLENIDLNGTRVLSNFCITTMAGLNKAFVKQYDNIAPDARGNIVIRVSAVPDSPDQNAKISTIETMKA